MTVASLPTATTENLPQPWHKAFEKPAVEFGPVSLKVLLGQVPLGLRGIFYQNGTGRLARGKATAGHWFDGDGAILSVEFAQGRATGTYRYVQTEGYLAEEEAGEYLYGNYGMRYPGPLWKHLLGLIKRGSIKNSANTSVLALEDRLLALWEAGRPYGLNLETLETLGEESLGWLKEGQPFSAHPLRDPVSGEIYSVGVNALCQLSIYRCDAKCRLLKETQISLAFVPMVHSFVIAGPYLVFVISPLRLSTLPLLLNQKCYADSIGWDASAGTRLIVVDRESLEIVSEGRAEPWFQFHFGNGCVEKDGSVRLDFARFDEFAAINEVLREVPSGRIETKAYGRLWQLRLNPKTGEVLSNECVLDRDCEFPQVPAQAIGQPWRYTYLLMHRDGVKTGEDWFGAIGRFDYETGELKQADLGEGNYGSEALYVADGIDPQQGWLLEVVYNAVAEQSELRVFDASTMGEPVCRLALPEIVPIGFHGTWQAA